jgi:hypothetical protein
MATRFDLVSLKGQGVAGILIDGKKSSSMAGTWAATQSLKTPIDYRPAIRKVGIGGQPVAETWTLTADNISEDGKRFLFSLEGSVSGFQGRGGSYRTFYLREWSDQIIATSFYLGSCYSDKEKADTRPCPDKLGGLSHEPGSMAL